MLLFSPVKACVVAVPVIAVALVSAAGARTAFSGNACKLIPAASVAALHISTKCTAVHTRVSWSGFWAGSDAGRIYLTVEKPPAVMIPALKATHNVGTPVKGLGSWSRDSGLHNGTYNVEFEVGAYFVNLGVSTPSKWPLKSSAPVVAMAKAVAQKL